MRTIRWLALVAVAGCGGGGGGSLDDFGAADPNTDADTDTDTDADGRDGYGACRRRRGELVFAEFGKHQSRRHGHVGLGWRAAHGHVGHAGRCRRTIL